MLVSTAITGHRAGRTPERGARVPGKMLTINDVAERMQVHRTTVENWTKRGQLPHVKLGAHRNAPIRIDEDDLDKFLKGRWVRRADSPS